MSWVCQSGWSGRERSIDPCMETAGGFVVEQGEMPDRV